MYESQIVILSSREDLATNRVMDYFRAWNVRNVLRINVSDSVSFSSTIENETSLLLIKNQESYQINNIKAFWHRHGYFYPGELRKLQVTPIEASEEISAFVHREWHAQTNFIYELLRSKALRSLGVRHQYDHNNKLLDLIVARSCGLKIPATKLVQNDSDALSFMIPGRRYVTKPLTSPPYVSTNTGSFSTVGTKEIFPRELRSKDHCIIPYLVQEYIEKKIEIRCFFLKGELFSMALFSQLSASSTIDFRNHKPSQGCMRMVPFDLPQKISARIQEFMNRLGLDTGSLDLIYSTDGGYYFLEVNPQGQFGWLSDACNYRLEEKIAQYLAYGLPSTEN